MEYYTRQFKNEVFPIYIFLRTIVILEHDNSPSITFRVNIPKFLFTLGIDRMLESRFKKTFTNYVCKRYSKHHFTISYIVSVGETYRIAGHVKDTYVVNEN